MHPWLQKSLHSPSGFYLSLSQTGLRIPQQLELPNQIMAEPSSKPTEGIAWLEEIGFARNPELQQLLHNNFVAQNAQAGNLSSVHRSVPIPDSIKFPRAAKSPTRKVPSLVSISAKTQYKSSGWGLEKGSPLKVDTSPGKGGEDGSAPGTNGVNVSKVFRSLDKQVEDWLASVVNQAGHSVVVPDKLYDAYKSIVSR